MDESLTVILRQMSPTDFAALGAHEMAFVKVVATETGPQFAVHAADGSPLAIVESRELASAICLQNNLEAVSVH